MAESRNKISITIVVSGQPALVKVNKNAPLSTVIPKALHETGNTGQPPENWELRDESGKLLDTSQKIGSFGFPETVRLFLSLKAGVGGSR
jgi:hypothetical protein